METKNTPKEYTRAPYWWLDLIAGIILILFGILIIAYPIRSLFILTLMFGIFLAVEGVVSIIRGIAHAGEDAFGWILALLGVLQIIASIYVLRYPGLSTVTFIYIFVIYLIVKGFYYIISPFFQDRPGFTKFLIIMLGIFVTFAGLALLSKPGLSGVIFALITGSYALVAGGITIGVSFQKDYLKA